MTSRTFLLDLNEQHVAVAIKRDVFEASLTTPQIEPLLMVLPFLKPWKSLHAELMGYFKDPRLQLAFTFQSEYLGMSPFQCPSLFSILSFLGYKHGIWHPPGGGNAISKNAASPTSRSASALSALLRQRIGKTK